MKRILLALLITVLFSCGNKTNEKITTQKAEEFNELIVTINFQTNKADTFKLVLNNIVVDESQKKNIQVIERIVPTTSMDIIEAKFGKNNFSNNFQIHFGNKETKEIDVSLIKLSYGNNNISISPQELEKYFSFNKFIEQDTITFKLTTKRIDGKHAPKITLKKKAFTILSEEKTK